MKNLLILILAVFITFVNVNGQTTSSTEKQIHMKLNAGILTEKLTETKAFYTEHLGFGVTFENEFYLLLHTPNHEAQLSFLLPNHEAQLSFLLPNHPSQQPLFRAPFQGQGMYLTIELEDVDKLCAELKAKGVKIELEIRDEPWGDRHFAIKDPNGIGIDFVRYTAPEENE